MDEENVVHVYNSISFTPEKEIKSDVLQRVQINSEDISLRNEPVIKRQMLYDSSYIMCHYTINQNYIDRE